MPAPPEDARSSRCEVLEAAPCGDDGVILRVRSEHEMGPLRASRFFMLRCEDGSSPLIPRPFSIYRQDGDDLEFLIKVMGPGTRALAEAPAGARLRLIGPLGNGWPTLDGDGPPWVMIAGGIGCAPFYMAIEQAASGMDGASPAAPDAMTLIFGAAHAGLLYDLDRLEALGARVLPATDDGSKGFHGNSVELLRDLLDRGELPDQVRLLACGPDPMLAAVERLARERGLRCWLSLETLMGCGVGICNGCPVETQPDGPMGDWPNAKACVEGPVFDVSAVSVVGGIHSAENTSGRASGRSGN